jgi:hypothetical protein
MGAMVKTDPAQVLIKNDNLKEALQERMRLYEEEHRQEDFSAMR